MITITKNKSCDVKIALSLQ